mmetsp:Transcript_42996/g.121866  ORF Transcript_42996/g.121866 Transcript_42996/m.121866 type:complete len:209 (+) Transcript_42996:342-968(+)
MTLRCFVVDSTSQHENANPKAVQSSHLHRKSTLSSRQADEPKRDSFCASQMSCWLACSVDCIAWISPEPRVRQYRLGTIIEVHDHIHEVLNVSRALHSGNHTLDTCVALRGDATLDPIDDKFGGLAVLRRLRLALAVQIVATDDDLLCESIVAPPGCDVECRGSGVRLGVLVVGRDVLEIIVRVIQRQDAAPWAVHHLQSANFSSLEF